MNLELKAHEESNATAHIRNSKRGTRDSGPWLALFPTVF